MDIDTTIDWLTAIAVVSGIGFVVLLALSHRHGGGGTPVEEDSRNF